MAQLVRQHFVELLCVFGAFQLSNSSLTYWYGCLQLRPRSVKSCPVSPCGCACTKRYHFRVLS